MIALIGHGYVGDHIAAELNSQNIPFHWITHRDTVPTGTTAIINAAGYTGRPNVDACEIYKQECIDGNVVFPLSLEQRYPHIPKVHITSGCVYTGYVDGGWTETDPPNFDFNNGSFYSGSKALFQNLVAPTSTSYLLRIRLPFGDKPNPKNYLTKLENYDKLIDFENSISYVNDVAAVAVHFAITLPTPGIYNVCNPGTTTTRAVAYLMGLDKPWFTVEEFTQATVAPRSNCNMSTDKLQAVFPLQTAQEALRKAIDAYRI